MTRKAAHSFMWNKDRELSNIKWASHKTIRDLVDLMIDEIFNSLEATIEAQEIIIKDKSAIMEATAQPKTCDGCKYNYYTGFNGQESECWLSYQCSRNTDDYYEPKAQS